MIVSLPYTDGVTRWLCEVFFRDSVACDWWYLGVEGFIKYAFAFARVKIRVRHRKGVPIEQVTVPWMRKPDRDPKLLPWPEGQIESV
jgi:hypothetical protein